jgi:hypothetical protein
VLASEITGLVNLKQIHNSRSALQQQVFSVEKDHWCFFFLSDRQDHWSMFQLSNEFARTISKLIMRCKINFNYKGRSHKHNGKTNYIDQNDSLLS